MLASKRISESKSVSKEALGIYDLEQVPHIVNSRGAASTANAYSGDRRDATQRTELSVSPCVYDIHFVYAPFSIKNVTA